MKKINDKRCPICNVTCATIETLDKHVFLAHKTPKWEYTSWNTEFGKISSVHIKRR